MCLAWEGRCNSFNGSPSTEEVLANPGQFSGGCGVETGVHRTVGQLSVDLKSVIAIMKRQTSSEWKQRKQDETVFQRTKDWARMFRMRARSLQFALVQFRTRVRRVAGWDAPTRPYRKLSRCGGQLYGG